MSTWQKGVRAAPASVTVLQRTSQLSVRRAAGAHAALQQDARAGPRVHGDVHAVPVLDLLAVVVGERDVVVDLADLVRVQVVQRPLTV